MNKYKSFRWVFLSILCLSPIGFIFRWNTNRFRIIRRIHKNNIWVCIFNESFQIKATSKLDITISISMNQHICCRKTIGFFFNLNTVNMFFFYLTHKVFGFFFSFSTSTISKLFHHCLYKERTTTTCSIKNTFSSIYACDTAHKLCNMVWCKCLILISLSCIFIKRYEEHIQNILTF